MNDKGVSFKTTLVCLLVWLFLTLFVGCNAPVQEDLNSNPYEIGIVLTELWTETPIPTALPPATATIIATATLTPTLTPTSTPTKTPTKVPSSTPLSTCPKPGSAVAFAYPANTTRLQDAMLAFLNAGGQWDELLVQLDELEIKHDLIEADINGDGVMETAVYARTLDQSGTPDHAWWIFQCRGDQYDVIYRTGGTWAFHDYFMVDDLNNDHLSEIIAVMGFAGSACDLEPLVLSWQVNRVVAWSPDYLELELGCSGDDQVLLQDLDGDNFKEMILIGETVGHIDYAPPRGITQTFTLQDTGGYRLIDTVFAPADLRVQVLDDAQRALDAGDLPLAVAHYMKAAYEEMTTLESYYLAYPYIIGDNIDANDYQKAFALFRLLVIQRVTGNAEEANSILTELNTQYVENEPGYEFVVLAQIFADTFEQRESLAQACRAVTNHVSQNYQVDKESPHLTSHFYWGSNIASYQIPDSFCPVFTIPKDSSP